MSIDPLGARFPAGEAVMRAALRREQVSPELVDLRLAYTGVSWSLHVTCASAGYRRVAQLPPEALRADTAWSELCESVAEDLAGRIGRHH
ncbi:MAG: hypothetical protein M3019_00440 [Candidatus Dormibacteraeota bacterium]|nr:hypothetical protein [Candidatus Dormibacteraeota bacterium]